MSNTVQAIRANRYDFTAVGGVVLAALPELINLAMTATDLPSWAVWGLRIAGVLVAAQGKPLMVTGDA